MNASKVAAGGLMLTSIVVWAVPTVIYSMLLRYQFTQGNGSLFLVLLGPAEYWIALCLSIVLPAIYLRQGRTTTAITLSVVSLVVGVPFAALGVLMLGSA